MKLSQILTQPKIDKILADCCQYEITYPFMIEFHRETSGGFFLIHSMVRGMTDTSSTFNHEIEPVEIECVDIYDDDVEHIKKGECIWLNKETT